MMSYDYPHPVSRTYQYKKITKPLLERKRRARINRYLDELKDLMVDASETEGEDISKLEKADILELTVRHLQKLQASRSSSGSSGPIEGDVSGENRWLSGFGHCAAEACRFLSALPGEGAERLARHLAVGLQTNRQTNATPNAKLLADLDRTANLVAPRSPSPAEVIRIASPCQIPSRRSTPYPEVKIEKTCPSPGVSSQCNSPPISISEQSSFTTDSENPSTVKIKTLESDGGADDDEEIDVEHVDEADPMWRPW